MKFNEIIASLLDQAQDRDSSIDENDPDCIFRHDAAALRAAVELLKKTHEPNEPLTLDELRQMDGEPVWCVDGSGNRCWGIVYVYGENPDEFECYASQYKRIPGWCYGMEGRDGWLAYRRRPEVQ